MNTNVLPGGIFINQFIATQRIRNRMFVILVYDVNVKRTNKILKICRKYLIHVQKSVFEGTITEAKLNKLKSELGRTCKKEEDSIMIYRCDSLRYSSKEVIGLYTTDNNFL